MQTSDSVQSRRKQDLVLETSDAKGALEGTMSEAKKHPCLFGLGDCPVMSKLTVDAEQIELETKVMQYGHPSIPDELVECWKRVMTANVLGPFCPACNELKKREQKE